jgi:glycerophosphoryl diester phosphodiesterase
LFEIVAHRGAPNAGQDSVCAPENTLPAFWRALELGADTVELDVRLTSDQVPVVYHYFYLDDRTTLTGPIFQHTWAEISEARVLLAGRPDLTDFRISSLDEVLDSLAGRIGLEIEIKGPEPACSEIVAEVLKNHPAALENLEITSYETTLLERFRCLMPGIPVDLNTPLTEPWMKDDVWAYVALQRGKLAGVRAVHLHASQLSAYTVDIFRKGGCEAHAWAINDLPALKAAAELNITRICTDNLPLALQYQSDNQTNRLMD